MKPVENQNLAVVYGGYSSEIEISVKSGKSVAAWLRNAGRKVYEIMLCGRMVGGRSVRRRQ